MSSSSSSYHLHVWNCVVEADFLDPVPAHLLGYRDCLGLHHGPAGSLGGGHGGALLSEILNNDSVLRWAEPTTS